MAKEKKEKKQKKQKEKNTGPKLSLFAKIRKFFQPYWNPKPKVEKVKPEKVKKNKKGKKESENVTTETVEDVKTIETLDNNKNDIVETENQTDSQETTPEVINSVSEEVKKSVSEEIKKPVSEEVKKSVPEEIKKPVSNETKKPVAEPKVIKQPVTEKPEVKKSKFKNTMPYYENPTLKMPIKHVDIPLDLGVKLPKLPAADSMWFYHDANRHQVLGHFKMGTGFKYTLRDDDSRKRMKCVIHPVKTGKPFDRTHLIPFGYHNSDNDMRLIIGWDANQNRNELMQFESKAKHIPEDIYWLTDVRKTSNGAMWKYSVYSAKTHNLLNSLTVSMPNTEFKWNR